MNDGGKVLLKVASILFIIYGAILTVISLIALINSAGTGTVWIIAMVILLCSGLVELIIGIVGYKKSEDPSDASYFIVTGFALAVLVLISMVMSFSAWSLIGFLLPVLYIAGGYMLRRSIT